MPAHEVKVLDSVLHYTESGKGDPIVFLHGNPTRGGLRFHGGDRQAHDVGRMTSGVDRWVDGAARA